MYVILIVLVIVCLGVCLIIIFLDVCCIGCFIIFLVWFVFFIGVLIVLVCFILFWGISEIMLLGKIKGVILGLYEYNWFNVKWCFNVILYNELLVIIV